MNLFLVPPSGSSLSAFELAPSVPYKKVEVCSGEVGSPFAWRWTTNCGAYQVDLLGLGIVPTDQVLSVFIVKLSHLRCRARTDASQRG